MWLTHKDWAAVGLGLALALMALIAVVSYQTTTGFVERARSVDHTHEVLLTIKEVVSQLKDAETGERGFVLTGETRYLEPYDSALKVLDRDLQTLARLTADDPAQQTRIETLKGLVSEKLSELDSGVFLKKELPRTAEAEDWVKRGRGKELMDQIRELAAGMERHEYDLLARRALESNTSRRLAVSVIVAGNVASGVILLVAFGFLRREIAQRREAERALQRRAGEIEDLYNNAPCGYHSVDASGLIVRINDTELSWLGYARDEVVGKMRHPDLMTPESAQAWRENFRRFREHGYLESVEFDYRCKDGSTFTASLNATAVHDADGNYLFSRSTIFDISDRKRAARQIEALNRDLEIRATQLESANKELESFSYSVSHDLRTPLRAIDGFSRVLEEDYGQQFDVEGKRLLKVIRDNGQKMGRLIDDLLTFSRLGSKPISTSRIDMGALAHEMFGETVPAAATAPIRWACHPMPEAWGDRTLLRQVWANLLSNAVKFSGHRGEPLVEAGGRADGGSNVYYVRDNGAGFDMRYYDKLFGVFQRLHGDAEFPGTGVGLAIVHRVVSRHGGRVWAESAPDQGATFYFTLPAEGE